MRRVYDSAALASDDDDPTTPTDRDDRPTAGLSGGDYRTVNWRKVSHAVVPTRLRHRAVDVAVETDATTYDPDTPVRFRVRMRNRAPFPVVLVTESPVRWRWALDGLPGASKVADADPPGERRTFAFERREVKTFTRRWNQRVQVAERRWEPATRGEHTVAATVNVADAEAAGLSDEATFTIA